MWTEAENLGPVGIPSSDRQGGGEVLTGFWWRHLRKRDQLENPDVIGRIIFKWILRRSDGGHELY